tara:strand:+ start:10230 stop:11936 length:1707 start_codon:yes stop_codon:yes gene_type:complete
MVIPFLGILFETQEKVYNPSPLTFNPTSIKDNFYAFITEIIDNQGKLDALFFICLLVLITFFLRNLFRYLALYFLTPIRNGVVHDIRMLLHKKILTLPLSFFTEKRKGDLTARLTSDLVEVEWSIMSSLEMVFKDPLTIIVYLGSLLFISSKLTLLVIILFPISGIIIGTIGKSLKKSSNKGQEKMGKILSIIFENITGLRIIKSFNAENHINNNFHQESKKYESIMNSLLRKKDLSSPMSEFLSTIVMVIVMWVGGQLVLSSTGGLSPQEFIGYIVIFSQIIPPAKSLTTSYYYIQKGSASAERIYEILDVKNSLVNKSIKKIDKFNNCIEFQQVCFSYKETEILQNINFSIKKGQMLALVGHSGSGKSTIADILTKFYIVNSGEVLIDNININNIQTNELRKLFGIVSQEPILFNDTIRNNISLGKLNATKEEIVKAAKIANAHDFIIKLENKYNTNVGEKGDKLSGGEKQRISIARAILNNPEILILDEATSALDIESENLVQDALSKLMKSRTSIVIAHKLSTIQNADKIIVLNKGQIVESGNHKQLINNKGHYKKLYELQSFS